MMDNKYRYKKLQILKKKIRVSKDVRQQIYSKTLTLENYMLNNLYDIVPTSCLNERERAAVERIGVEKLKNLNILEYRSLNNYLDDDKQIDLYELIINAEPNTNIKELLQDTFKDKVPVKQYTQGMIERFSDLAFDLSKISPEERFSEESSIKRSFNDGSLQVSQIVDNWDLLKDKDFSKCKINSYSYQITEKQIREFMDLCGVLHELLEKIDPIERYINDLCNPQQTKEEQNKYLKQFAKRLVKKENGYYDSITKEEFKTIFKFYPIQDYLYDTQSAFIDPEIVNYMQEKGMDLLMSLPFEPDQLFRKDILEILYACEKNNIKSNDFICKLISSSNDINDKILQENFKKFVVENIQKINETKIDKITEILKRLANSNSSELYNFKSEIALQLLDLDNPIDSLNKIENMFIRNNIPVVGKVYSVFKTLHPEYEEFDFGEESRISPVLKSKSKKGRDVVIFSDLIKLSLGSNNRSLKNYLNNIGKCSALYSSLKHQKIKIEDLSEEDIQELKTFRSHCVTLYDNTLRGKLNNTNFELSNDIVHDIDKLTSLFQITDQDNLSDRIVSMFCHYAGIDTLKQATDLLNTQVQGANQRNRESSTKKFELNMGDLIKGIGGIKYLNTILQNGSVSTEFLGVPIEGDYTPLDTDLSMMTKKFETIRESIQNTAAKDYGSILFVLKNSSFNITRTNNKQEKISNYDPNKLELFYSGFCNTICSEHYGIRTGFPSSAIDSIISMNNDKRVGLEIAMNGFYIPVYNADGFIIFTPNDYDNLRAKMGGLTQYGEEHYTISNNLDAPGIKEIESKVESCLSETEYKRNKINNAISRSLEKSNLQLKTKIDGDLSTGSVELIDTGSTGRGTNKPGDGDFDFMMRLDKSVLNDPNKFNELKQSLLQSFGKTDNEEITSTGDFRLKDVVIDDVKVDIDITFTGKTDKISYSTDMCLHERLNNIKKQYPDKYSSIVANILLAKQVLKEANAYKPSRSDNNQGGLGGVGIENWILQNGGSFTDAATKFLAVSKDKTFEEFKSSYQVWDFGENHMSEKKDDYVHDNFVECNMSEQGYEKMKLALTNYMMNVYQNENGIQNGNGIQIEQESMSR